MARERWAHRYERAQPVAVAQGSDGVCERVHPLRLLQEIDWRVTRQLPSGARVHRLVPQQPVEKWMDVGRLWWFHALPGKRAGVLSQQPNTIYREKVAFPVEKHEARDRGHVERLMPDKGPGGRV